MMEDEILIETIKQEIKEEPIEEDVSIKDWEFRNSDIKLEQNSIEFINSIHDIADVNFGNYFHDRGLGEIDIQIKQESEDHIGEKEEIVKKEYEDLVLKQEHDDFNVIEEHIDNVIHKDSCSSTKCDQCDFISEIRCTLEMHMDSCHKPSISKKKSKEQDISGAPNRNQNKCEICSKIFKCQRILDMHRQGVHGERTHECPVCHNKFVWKHSLDRHVEVVHNKIRFKCTICHNELDWKQRVTHMISAHKKMSYECEVCHKIYRYKRMLDSHMKAIHHGIKYKCTICDKTFSQKHCHDEHVKPVYDKIKYECKICNMMFRLEENLDIHMKVIHDEINMHENL